MTDLLSPSNESMLTQNSLSIALTIFIITISCGIAYGYARFIGYGGFIGDPLTPLTISFRSIINDLSLIPLNLWDEVAFTKLYITETLFWPLFESQGVLYFIMALCDGVSIPEVDPSLQPMIYKYAVITVALIWLLGLATNMNHFVETPCLTKF